MTRHALWRLKSAGRVTASCVLVSLLYESVDTGGVSLAGVTIGIALALPLIVLEESGFDRRMRRRSFSVALLTRSLIYLASIAAVFMSVSFVGGYLQGLSGADYRSFLLGVGFRRQLAAGFAMYLAIVFFRQLDRLLGPGILLRYLRGRYHEPRRETRGPDPRSPPPRRGRSTRSPAGGAGRSTHSRRIRVAVDLAPVRGSRRSPCGFSLPAARSVTRIRSRSARRRRSRPSGRSRSRACEGCR